MLVVVGPPHDEHFVLQASGARLACPEFTLPVTDLAGDSLADVVERAAARTVGLRLTYLAMLSSGEAAGVHELVALCTLQQALRQSELDRRDLHLVPVDELGRSSQRIDRLDQFERAAHWRLVDRSAHRLVPQIEHAFDMSVAVLNGSVAEEDGHSGWSQYLDGGGLGVLSTAQGLLAHVHAGRSDMVTEAAETLLAFQNDDGGWQVRRALVGGPSPKSITESTCYCLWALQQAGSPADSRAVRKGIAWLEERQQRGGGWQSSDRSGDPNVVATAAAVRVLARAGKLAAVERGVQWLRNAQLQSGGWAATARATESGQAESPAYTAHAIIALRWAGVPTEDQSVANGCDYLRATFDPAAEEPWAPTASNVVVDESTSARMEFKHFATPWALAALASSGRDVGDRTVFLGTVKLLRLQQPGGQWRCRQTAPGTYATWALHDALYALRAVLSVSTRDLAPVALAEQQHVERLVMQDLVRRLLATPAGAAWRAGRGWATRAWVSAVTAALALLLASQVGLLRGLGSNSEFQRLAATGITFAIGASAAIAPSLIAEEYKLMRRRGGH